METIALQTPLADEDIRRLRTGDGLLLSGQIYTARDAAHKEMARLARQGLPMPFPFRGQAVYYAGPCPNRPGHVIGSIGPTTSGRMDSYAAALIPLGLKIMIGKGTRDKAVIEAITAYGGVYFAAIGGAGALLARCVTRSELVAFPELGAEAVRKLTVVNFPVIVAIDAEGRNIYERKL